MFTPKSFVTHSANLKESELEKTDLLPKIKDKCIVIPELAPIFGKRREDLLENLTILTRIFDGEGLESDSGSRGHRGYTGKYIFAWLGATTPLSYNVWKTMGKLGARLLFLNMKGIEADNEELEEIITGDKDFEEKLKACRRAVSRFLKILFRNGIGNIEWNRKADPRECVQFIVKCSKLLARLRGLVDVYEVKTESNETHYSFRTPLIEGPQRAINILYNLARGHAIIHSRRQLSMEDMRPVIEVVLSSMPFDRGRAFKLLIESNTPVNVSDLKAHLRCSGGTAKKIMETLNILGIVDLIETDDDMKCMSLKEEFTWVKEAQRQVLSQDKS